VHRVLITNDDGVDAPGLAALADELHLLGFEVVVAAPMGNRSGSGAALGAVDDGTTIAVRRAGPIGKAGLEGFAVDAPPAMIAHAISSGAMGAPPDAVVSGINDGHNTGRGILHSGTVGAALTAASLGVPSLAVSTGHQPESRFDTAARFAGVVLGLMHELAGVPALNLNVPSLDMDEIMGVREGHTHGLGVSDVAYEYDSLGFSVRKIRNRDIESLAADAMLVQAGYVSLSRLGVFGGELAMPPGFLVRVDESAGAEPLPVRLPQKR
jgi:5'-nucleotidase